MSTLRLPDLILRLAQDKRPRLAFDPRLRRAQSGRSGRELRVDPERRFFTRLKRGGLAPPNGPRKFKNLPGYLISLPFGRRVSFLPQSLQ